MLLFPGVEEMDFVGPYEIFGKWGLADPRVRLHLICEAADKQVICAKGMTVVCTHTFAEAKASLDLDYLLVPGGKGTRLEATNQVLLEFIRTFQGRSRLLSVCSGAFLYASAGVLGEKQRITTHWRSIARLRDLAIVKEKSIEVVEARYVLDESALDTVWSSRGVSAGTDMALAIVAKAAGRPVAARVQLQAEYYPNEEIYGTEEELRKHSPDMFRDERGIDIQLPGYIAEKIS